MWSRKLFLMTVAVLAPGCLPSSGDRVILSDGRVVEGDLQSISSGELVFSDTTVTVNGQGRIWSLNGETALGNVAYSRGVFSADGAEFPADSVRLILWNQTEVESHVFEVDASLGWQSTGIQVQPGDIVAIKAEGLATMETGTAGPGGQERFSSVNAPVPEATAGQLVLRAGEQGTPLATGAVWSTEILQGGVLEFAVNVPVQGSIEPSGVYTVHLTTGSAGRQPGTTAFYPASR